MSRAALTSVALLFLAAAVLPALAQGDRPAIAEEVEKRFNDRFLFATNGSGSYTIYQRVEANLVEPREVVCMMRECYVAIATAPEEALRRASREPAVRRPLLLLLGVVRDAYTKVLATQPAARRDVEREWLDRAAAIAPCIAEGRCGER